ncbi:hypothetical protein GCM10027270_20250 [Nocardioides ginkgobilobae]
MALLTLSVLLGIGVLATGLLGPWGPRAGLCIAIVGIGLLGNVPFLARQGSGSVRWADRVSTRDSATVIAYDRVPAYAAAWALGWTTLVAVLGTSFGVAGGHTGVSLLLGLPFVLLFGLPLVDTLLALLRGAEVVADRERLTVRSWHTESSIAWDDVERVTLDLGPRGMVIAAAGYTAGTSWRGRRLPHVLPGRVPIAPGRVDIDSRAVEPHSPWLLLVLQDWAADPSTRAQIGTAEAERRLRQMVGMGAGNP